MWLRVYKDFLLLSQETCFNRTTMGHLPPVKDTNNYSSSLMHVSFIHTLFDVRCTWHFLDPSPCHVGGETPKRDRTHRSDVSEANLHPISYYLLNYSINACELTITTANVSFVVLIIYTYIKIN